MILDLLLSTLGIIITIFIVVGIHEGAHFWVARRMGIKVLRCSIGFGKPLYSWHDKKGTEYVLAPIPLGGYVKLLDENEEEVAESEKHLAFNRQPLYARFAVVAAGPFSNLLMAVLLYWGIFVLGFDTPIPIIGAVEPHSIASQAGLKPQQVIVSVDGHHTYGWQSITMRLVMHIGDNDTTALGVKEYKGNSSIHTQLLNLQNWQMNDLKPDPLSSLGITPYEPEIPVIIGKIKSDSPAASSLRVGDKIVAINGKAISNWESLLNFIHDKPDLPIRLTISRDHHQSTVQLTLSHQRDLYFHKHGFLGIGPNVVYPQHLLQKIQYGPLDALPHAFNEVVQLSYLNVLLFAKLVMHKLSVLSLGGPITIFESAGSAFQYGLVAFMAFLAFLNVALGIINFFPIPGLDGGHLLFQFIEAIRRRPVSLRVQMLCYRLGFIFLVFILLQALTNDLLRLWG